MNGFKPVSELTARLTFGPTGFHNILVCEWIQTGAKSTKNHRILNVLLTTSLYMNQLFTPFRFVLFQILEVIWVGTLKNGALGAPLFAWFWTDPCGTSRWGGGERCASWGPLLII